MEMQVKFLNYALFIKKTKYFGFCLECVQQSNLHVTIFIISALLELRQLSYFDICDWWAEQQQRGGFL